MSENNEQEDTATELEKTKNETIDESDMEEGDDIKRITLFPAINDLVHPTTKVIGKAVAKKVSDWIGETDQDRKGNNVSRHLERNKETLKKAEDAKVTEKQRQHFASWIQDVGDVDVDIKDDPLSNLWSSLLNRILMEEDDYELLHSELKKLNIQEAKILINGFSKDPNAQLTKRED